MLLQAGQHEILGAHYGGGPAVHDTTRVIKPALVNCRKANFVKAQQYGRWIVLNYKNPGGSVGEQVLHEDSILLEQEWCYLASKTPYDSHMEKKMSFEEVAAGGLVDVFKPSTEAVWKMHIVALPSDDNIDNRVRQYLLVEAQHQMNTSAKERRAKVSELSDSDDVPIASQICIFPFYFRKPLYIYHCERRFRLN